MNHFPSEGRLGHKSDFLGYIQRLPTEEKNFVLESYHLWVSGEREAFQDLEKHRCGGGRGVVVLRKVG